MWCRINISNKQQTEAPPEVQGNHPLAIQEAISRPFVARYTLVPAHTCAKVSTSLGIFGDLPPVQLPHLLSLPKTTSKLLCILHQEGDSSEHPQSQNKTSTYQVSSSATAFWAKTFAAAARLLVGIGTPWGVYASHITCNNDNRRCQVISLLTE
jgi:hypothetical protein